MSGKTWWLLAKFVCVLMLCDSNAFAERPNIVIIQTDDQGWGDVGFHGNRNISTPQLDQLAKRGARFDRFFVCPVCAPTRAELLTGRYHLRGGVSGVSRGAERLNVDERTLAHVFKAAGYATAAFGKWHNGTQYPYHPNARGFDEFYGYCSGHWGDYFSPVLEHNGEPVRGNGYLVDDFTDHAIEFIERNVTRKFFCYLPLPTPHSPMQVPDKYWERWKDRPLVSKADHPEGKPEDEAFTRAALAMVECIDDNVGRLLAKLDELQLTDDTIVVFLSDNGPNSFRWNAGMKGIKGSTDEGGVRSPLYISWPGSIAANKLVLQITGAIDLLPTLADLADVPLLGVKPLDGVSLAPLLTGTAGSIPDRMLFSHWNGQISVRTQQYRLDAKGKLFDMVNDPGQLRDVSQSHPAVANELQSHVDRWRAEMKPLTSERPFTVGHPDFAVTQLPARDADPLGNVQRSATAPNCSYFTNWNASGDGARWPVDVLEGGNFEITAYYTCAANSVGTQLQLTQRGAGIEEAQITKVIDQPHEPPEIGAEHDRVPRKSESYVKEFAPLNLGRLELAKGPGELVLTTPEIQGDGIEIRLLFLRRVP